MKPEELLSKHGVKKEIGFGVYPADEIDSGQDKEVNRYTKVRIVLEPYFEVIGDTDKRMELEFASDSNMIIIEKINELLNLWNKYSS